MGLVFDRRRNHERFSKGRMNPRLLCPACKKPLAHNPIAGGVEIWCGYGPCKSKVANNGATGTDLEDARGNLLDKINLEAVNRERAEFGLGLLDK